MTHRRPAPAPRVALAIGLAAAAGYVDAFGYRVLGQLMVAHMSGNTAAGAVHLVEGHVREALWRLLPIPAFFVGSAAGAAFSVAMARAGVRRRTAAVLGAELVLLALFAAVDSLAPSLRPVSAMLLSATMGMQSAVARHVAGHDIRTTFVTGMIVAAADELVAGWFHGDGEKTTFAALHLGVYVAFFLGALAGAFAAWRLGTASLLAPAFVILGFAVADLRKPRPISAM